MRNIRRHSIRHGNPTELLSIGVGFGTTKVLTNTGSLGHHNISQTNIDRISTLLEIGTAQVINHLPEDKNKEDDE